MILFTKVFPYFPGEDFLEDEIGVLAKTFDRMIIVATAVPYGSVQRRSVPENVKVYVLSEVRNKYLKYAKYVFKGIGYLLNKQTKSELKGKKTKEKLGIIYFSGRCHSLAKKILKIPELLDTLKFQDTILYSYWFSDLPYVSVLIKAYVNNAGLRLVSRAHGYDLYDYRNASGSIPFRKTVMREVNMVYPCSRDGQSYLTEQYPEYKNKIRTSYLGTKDCGAGDPLRQGNRRIVTCSSIIPLKRVHLIAEALLELEKMGETVDWICIGGGPLLDEIKKFTEDNLKKSSVKFTGRLLHAEVLSKLGDSYFDLFLNVSETEGLPVSIMEAISFGIPVLATDVGGTKEIVIPGLTGYLLPADTSPKEIAENILKCFDTAFDRDQIRRFWFERFNSDNNFRVFAEEIIQI